MLLVREKLLNKFIYMHEGKEAILSAFQFCCVVIIFVVPNNYFPSGTNTTIQIILPRVHNKRNLYSMRNVFIRRGPQSVALH